MTVPLHDLGDDPPPGPLTTEQALRRVVTDTEALCRSVRAHAARASNDEVLATMRETVRKLRGAIGL